MAEESDLERTEAPSQRRLEQAREEGQVPRSRELNSFALLGAAVPAQAEITVRVDLGRGAAKASVYTCDFSYDYVKINADYRS